MEEQIKTTTASADELSKNEETVQETISQSQTVCQQVSNQLQRSLANDLEDQAFLAQFEQTAPYFITAR